MSNRRLRIFKVSGVFFNELLRASLFRGMTSNAPKDVQVVGFYRQCPWDDTFEFVVMSEEFESVPEGEELPIIDFEFTAHYEERPAP